MNLSRYIARRYLRSRNSHSVINIIARVSTIAMAVPVVAMVVLMSVFNGLEGMLRNIYLAVDADIVISSAEGTTFVRDSLASFDIGQVEGVRSVSYTLEQGAIAEYHDNRTMLRVKGVDEAYAATLPIERHLTSGYFMTDYEGTPTAVATQHILLSLRMTSISPAEPFSLYAINRQRISTILPTGGYTRRDVGVAGIYNIDDQHSDVLFISLSEAQRLFNYGGRCSAAELAVAEGADVERVRSRLATLLGDEYRVLTRDEGNTIYRLMAIEKWGVFLLSLIVMAIASLTIVGVLVMVIIDKREERATLLTLGATPSLVRRVFTSQGMMMVWRSMVGGVVVGVVLTLLQQHFGLVRIGAASLMVDAYPVELQWGDVVAVAVGYYAVASIIVRLTVRAMER